MKQSTQTMKQSVLVITACIVMLFARSQTGDSLRVYWNGHLVLNQVNTGKDTPVIHINKGEERNAALSLSLKQSHPQKMWKRIFQLTDTVNNIILQKEFAYSTGSYTLQDAAIQKFLLKHHHLLVYSFVKPPAGTGSNIRIARFLLCKLTLQ